LKITCTVLYVITGHRGAWHLDVLILAMPEPYSASDKVLQTLLTTSLNYTLVTWRTYATKAELAFHTHQNADQHFPLLAM